MPRQTTLRLWTFGILLGLGLGTQGHLTLGLFDTSAEPLLVGRYEVKFLLKADSFLKSQEASIEERRPEARSPYFTPDPTVQSQTISIRFLDDKRLLLHEAGWVGVRQALDAPLELVYKKRYPKPVPGLGECG